MKPPVLLARIFYTKESGAGHVFRSLAIIECALREGWRVCVVTEADLRPKVPLEHESLAWVTTAQNSEVEQDSARCISYCDSVFEASPDLVWLDHYLLDHLWEAEMSKLAAVACIDDLCRNHHPKTWVIDYFPGRKVLEYDHPSEKLLLGLRYFLLRKDFRSIQKPKEGTRLSNHLKLLLQFGGANKNTFDLAVLNALHNDTSVQGEVTWLQGHSDLLAFWTRTDLVVNVVDQCHHMAGLYADHDIALGAAGVSMWERILIGLPSIIWQVADNQRDNFRQGEHHPLVSLVENEPSENASLWLSHIHTLTKQIAPDNSPSATDVFGANRVWNSIVPNNFNIKAQIQFELYSHKRIKELYALQCLPGVRQFSRNPEPPTWEGHQQWSENLLSSDSQSGWLGVLPTGQTIAWLKLDTENNKGFREVSLLVDPEFHGMCIGQRILSFAKGHWPKISAYVDDRNHASQKIFLRQGFRQKGDWFFWVEDKFNNGQAYGN